MEYKILANRKGFITTRNTEEIGSDDLYVTFNGAPQGATAIFVNKSTGNSIYRLLEDDTCSVPNKFLATPADFQVVVTVLNSSSKTPKYNLEEFSSTKTSDGSVCVLPNDGNLPNQVVEIQTQIGELTEKYNTLAEKIEALSKKLDDLLEGYDIL